MIQQTKQDEIKHRISQTLAAHPGDVGVVLAWRAYLGACVECRGISLDVHSRLARLLPEGVGARELEIVMIGVEEV